MYRSRSRSRSSRERCRPHAFDPAFDVRAGALALARSTAYLPEGVILAVVDPGVGTDRKAIAVEVAEGAGVFVAPDNGLIAPAVAIAGGAERAFHITNSDIVLSGAGGTFDGRDVLRQQPPTSVMAERSKTSAPNLTHRC